MIISLDRRLFKEDPVYRFSRSFKCTPDTWRNVWRKHKILDYSEDEAYEYLVFILRVNIRKERFKRWVKRTEAYNKAQVAIKKGATQVKKEYFGNLQEFVLREITKNDI